MSKESQIANEIFGLEMDDVPPSSQQFLEKDLEPFINQASKQPELLSTYIDFEGQGSDAEDSPWLTFARDHYIDPHILRVTTILLVAIARVNARKSQVDDNILKFYVNLKNELALYLRHQQKLKSLSVKDMALIQYLARRMAVSRLAEYEDSLIDSGHNLTGNHSVNELRDFLL